MKDISLTSWLKMINLLNFVIYWYVYGQYIKDNNNNNNWI